MARPAKRARVHGQNEAHALHEEDEDHDDYPEDEDDADMDGYDDMNDEMDADGDPDDTDGDREAQALVQALGGTSNQGAAAAGARAQQQPQHEHIVDYCYWMGYFPANEAFPSAATAGRFRAAPLRPQRTLDKNPRTRRSWNPKQPASWCAVLLQCGGQEILEYACSRCAEGQGFWTQCVVPNDWATSWITRGACANCYMDGKRATCSRGFGMAISPNARAKATAAQPEPSSSGNAVASTTAAPFTAAGFAPPVEAPPSTIRRRGRQAQPPADFEGMKRHYNTLLTSELNKLAEKAAAERARISLQLAAIDAVRAAREAFANQQPNGAHPG